MASLMCNTSSTCSGESKNSANQQHYQQSTYLMGSPSSTSPSRPGSATSSNDDSRRVKFLCSFLGSIMPRPQDGKLRYVGGETRIVSLLRDICYEDLMSKLRELYEGATVLKYQQPDEDLDALVSVVNDDDVVNMMEEYDKLGSCDSFTKLRLFLFSHSDYDDAVHFIDGDDRKSERRYVDALNNLNDTCELRKQQLDDTTVGVVEDMHAPEQFLSPINVDGRLHSQRSSDLSLLPHNLRLNIPHMGSGQHQQTLPVTHRCDVEMPWSSGYYSPRHHGHHDPRSLAEFPSPPSATRHRFHFSDSPTEEFTIPQVSHQPVYEHKPQYPENIVWYPPGLMPNEKAGFPSNILHGPAFEGNGTCERCRGSYLRGQPHLEPLNLVNGSQQVANPCAECHLNRENFVLTADMKMHHVIYNKERSKDSRAAYNDCQSHGRGRFVHHHINNQVEEAGPHVLATGRLNDRHIVDSPGVNFSVGQGNLAEGNLMSSSYAHLQNGHECGNEVFRDQTGFSGSHVRISHPEDCGVHCGNTCYAYTGDNHYSSLHGPVPAQGLWRNSPVLVGPGYEAFGAIQQVNGTANPGFVRTEGNPSSYLGLDNQAPQGDSSQKFLEYEGKLIPDYPTIHDFKPNNTIHGHDKQQPILLDSNHPPTNNANMEYIPFLVSSSNLIQNKGTTVMPVDVRNDDVLGVLGESPCAQVKVAQNLNEVEVPSLQCNSSYVPHKDAENVVAPAATVEPSPNKKTADNGNACKAEKDKSPLPDGPKLSVNNLSFVPDLIASTKKAAVEGAEEVKAKVEEYDVANMPDQTAEEPTTQEVELNDQGDVVLELENENINACRIEPTKAEEEAISRGLQTIKNDDLEEVRELGSGTYGAVYHGKWKGSDVAIKRIKASCFAGKPSERERLIADFWKEALILGSLHHPNVVSFYGIVRDGPDGSLATVTEFMINGSLKQFLQKKDRTIDRRKRLIIAMDAAFGMEYLHGKNIVHFDLKCENLLVNMRDPQRPVCKIGDLGLSKVKQHTLVSGGVRGTLPWMAPELLSGKSSMVTEKIDVYSFGIVMWELLTGEEPYADMHCASMIGGIVNNTLRPQIPAWCDPEWKSLMESCWASDPAARPSFFEISQKLRSMAAAMNVK